MRLSPLVGLAMGLMGSWCEFQETFLTDRKSTIRDYRHGEDEAPDLRAHGEVLYLIHELSRLISADFDRAMGAHDLRNAQWWALMHIHQYEGVTQSELAAVMQLGRASAGKVLERIEKHGWIERRADPEDQRVRRIYLTPKSQPIFDAMSEEGRNLFGRLLKGFTDSETAALLGGLRKLKLNAAREAS